MHAFDRQTNRQTPFSSLLGAGIPCRQVKAEWASYLTFADKSDVLLGYKFSIL